MLKQCQQSERLTFHFGTCPNNIISCQLKHYILQKKLNLNNRVQESNRVQKNWPGWLVAKKILVTKMLLLNVKSRVLHFLPIVECVLRYVSVCTTQTRPFLVLLNFIYLFCAPSKSTDSIVAALCGKLFPLLTSLIIIMLSLHTK